MAFADLEVDVDAAFEGFAEGVAVCVFVAGDFAFEVELEEAWVDLHVGDDFAAFVFVGSGEAVSGEAECEVVEFCAALVECLLVELGEDGVVFDALLDSSFCDSGFFGGLGAFACGGEDGEVDVFPAFFVELAGVDEPADFAEFVVGDFDGDGCGGLVGAAGEAGGDVVGHPYRCAMTSVMMMRGAMAGMSPSGPNA